MSCKARLMRMGFSGEQAEQILHRYTENGKTHDLLDYLTIRERQSISDRACSVLSDTVSPARSEQ